MSKPLSETEIRKREEELFSYLRAHPDATGKDIKNAGLSRNLYSLDRRINEVRKAVGVEQIQIRMPKRERKSRLLRYLKEHPETTGYDIREHLKGELYTDFNTVYGGFGGITQARKDAGIVLAYRKIRRKKKAEKLESSRGKVRDFLAQNPNAHITDIIEAGLYNDFCSAYKCRINDVRKELGLKQRKIYRHSLFYDIWGCDFQLSSDAVPDLAAALKPMLNEREFDIAKVYYGIGREIETLEEIGKPYKITGEAVRLIIGEEILPKLLYLNNQKAVANAVLPYVDEKTREFLKTIPEYSADNFLPYRLDQLYSSASVGSVVLEKAGIITVGQFLAAYRDDQKIWGFGKKKRAYLLKELRKFGIEV